MPCHATPAAGTPTAHANATYLQGGESKNPDTFSDILIQNSKGEGVPSHELRWESSPYKKKGGDHLRLLELVPGHYFYRSSDVASDLCKLVGTDLRSQFYKNQIGRAHV